MHLPATPRNNNRQTKRQQPTRCRLRNRQASGIANPAKIRREHDAPANIPEAPAVAFDERIHTRYGIAATVKKEQRPARITRSDQRFQVVAETASWQSESGGRIKVVTEERSKTASKIIGRESVHHIVANPAVGECGRSRVTVVAVTAATKAHQRCLIPHLHNSLEAWENDALRERSREVDQTEIALDGWIAEAGEARTGIERACGIGAKAGQIEIDAQAGVGRAIVVQVQVVPGGQHPVR